MTDSEAQRERILSESEESVERFDMASHERADVMDDDSIYDQGPSFVETERPTDRLTEMPAWLQTFAASEARTDVNSEEEGTFAAATVYSNSASSSTSTPNVADESLPDWLRAEPAHAQSATVDDTTDAFDNFQAVSSENADSFISEDDLPDWLRAFSHDATEAPSISAVSSPRPTPVVSRPATAMAVRVPPVENVWLSAYDRQALGPGRTLFALLASNSTIATETGTNGSYGTYDGVTDAGPRGETSSRATASSASTAATDSANAKEADGKPRNSMRLLLVALLVVVLLLIVSVTVLG